MNQANENFDSQLADFIEAVKHTTGVNFKSALLYGGTAKGDFTPGKSNVNCLLVFETINLDVLGSLALLIQNATNTFKLSPFLLTLSELAPSCDVFAVKLFDIQQHHKIIYGEDLIKDLTFNREHLKFISEQEIRNQLSRLKFFYLQNYNHYEALQQRIVKGITTLLVNSNMYLWLKHQKYCATRNEIFISISAEPGMDNAFLTRLKNYKDETLIATPENTNKAYDDLMLSFKHLLKLYKQV